MAPQRGFSHQKINAITAQLGASPEPVRAPAQRPCHIADVANEDNAARGAKHAN